MQKKIICALALLGCSLTAVAASFAKVGTVKEVLACKEAVSCPYFGALYRGDKNFRESITRKVPQKNIPDWLLEGAESPSLPVIYHNKTYLLASVCAPGDCGGMEFDVLYDPSSKESAISFGGVPLTKQTRQQIRILQSLHNNSSDLYKKIRQPYTPLPIEIR